MTSWQKGDFQNVHIYAIPPLYRHLESPGSEWLSDSLNFLQEAGHSLRSIRISIKGVRRPSFSLSTVPLREGGGNGGAGKERNKEMRERKIERGLERFKILGELVVEIWNVKRKQRGLIEWFEEIKGFRFGKGGGRRFVLDEGGCVFPSVRTGDGDGYRENGNREGDGDAKGKSEALIYGRLRWGLETGLPAVGVVSGVKIEEGLKRREK